MSVAKKHIEHYNRLNGNACSKAKLIDFHTLLKKDITTKKIHPNMPFGPECLQIEKKLVKAIDSMGDAEIVDKMTVTKISLRKSSYKATEKPTANKNSKPVRAEESMLHGLECIQKDGDLNGAPLGALGDTTYKVITDKILALIESDGLIWRKPWNQDHQGKDGHAHNYVTKSYYRGTNFYLNYLLLSDYKAPYFLTFRQVEQLKGTVKQGQKGWPVIYFKWLYKKSGNGLVDESEAMSGGKLKPGYDKFPALFYYTVFNSEQCEGLKLKAYKPVKLTVKEKIESCERIVKNMPQKPPVENVRGDSAHYSPRHDSITMPLMEQFTIDQQYYSTLFHEMVHSTGHPKRLDRDLGGRFGSKKYAFEELIAELGASYLCGESGVLYYTMKNTAAYIKSWSKALKEEMTADPKFFLRASASAEKSSEFILGKLQSKKEKARVVEVPKSIRESKSSLPPVKRKERSKATAEHSISGHDSRYQASENEIKAFVTLVNRYKSANEFLWQDFDKKQQKVFGINTDNVSKLFTKTDGVADYKISALGLSLKREIFSYGILPGDSVEKILFTKKKSATKKAPKLDGVVDASALAGIQYSTLYLNPEWKREFHKINSDSVAMFWGLPGSGKTVKLLRFAQYLSNDLKRKVLYVAEEEFGRSTLADKITQHKIGNANLHFAPDINESVLSKFDTVFLDSANSLKLTPALMKELMKRHPGKLWILIVQTTKEGDFRGGQDWEHLVDIAGEVSNRKLILRKNRLDPNNKAKADKLRVDEIVATQKEKAEIKKLVKQKTEGETKPVEV